MEGISFGNGIPGFLMMRIAVSEQIAKQDVENECHGYPRHGHAEQAAIACPM
jgi:hypothetical protein